MNRLSSGTRISSAALCAAAATTLAAIGLGAHAAQPVVVWSRLIATAQDDESRGLALDDVGGLHVGGITAGLLDDPVLGGGYSFVEKFSAAGDAVSGRQFGATGDSSYVTADSLAADSLGMYVVGATFGNMGGDNAGTIDGYVRKYDLTGVAQWSRQIGTADIDAANGVDSDGMGTIFVGGQTDGSLGGPTAGGRDAFLNKYDADGTLAWSRQFGTVDTDNILDVAADVSGSVYSTGFTYGAVAASNAGDQDLFIAKHDAAGSALWIRQAGSDALDQGVAAGIDSSGNVYVAGLPRGLIGGSAFGGPDVFLTKYDPLGTQLWLTQWGTDQSDFVGDLAVDADGNCYVVGGKANNPNGGTITDQNSFLVKFDSQGSPLWNYEWSTAVIDQAQAVAADGQGNVYVTGIQSTTRFDPYDIYLVKLHEVPEPHVGALSTIILTMATGYRRRNAA